MLPALLVGIGVLVISVAIFGWTTALIVRIVARFFRPGSSGLSIWNPKTGAHTSIRAGQGIPDDGVMRIQLDTMVDPPALHVATRGGAAVLRALP